jgi:hypothetical protein
MRMSPKLRVGLLIGGLGLTLGAVRWVDTLTDVPEASAGAVAEPAARARPATRAAAVEAPAAIEQPALDLKKLKRSPALDPEGDPFGPRSFRPAPPKAKVLSAAALAAQSAALPPPQAPPLPFAYIGRLSEDRDTTVFLALGDRNLVVKPGDTIDNTYKLEEISDSAVVLTYLPLGQRQALPIGEQ